MKILHLVKPLVGSTWAYCLTRDLAKSGVKDYRLWFKMYAAVYRAYNLQEPLYKMRDGRDAYKRRNWKNRKNEMYVKYIGYKMLGIKWYKWIYILRPLILFLLPPFIYNLLHRNR